MPYCVCKTFLTGQQNVLRFIVVVSRTTGYLVRTWVSVLYDTLCTYYKLYTKYYHRARRRIIMTVAAAQFARIRQGSGERDQTGCVSSARRGEGRERVKLIITSPDRAATMATTTMTTASHTYGLHTRRTCATVRQRPSRRNLVPGQGR